MITLVVSWIDLMGRLGGGIGTIHGEDKCWDVTSPTVSTLPLYDSDMAMMLIGQTVRCMVVRRRTIMKSTISSVKNQMKQKRMATENDNNNKRSSHISRTTTATIGSFIRGIKLRHHRPGM